VCLVFVECVAGCGGSGSGGSGGGLPAGVVASVGGRVVSLGTLEHWARAEGKLANMAQIGAANPAWVQPDPPSYRGCAARLAPAGATAAVLAGLRRTCQASYHDLQSKALAYLLRLMWEEQQAAEEHIPLTRPELEREYQTYTRGAYPNPGELQQLLAYAGLSVADETQRIKKNMLEGKLQERALQRVHADAGNKASEHAAQVRESAKLARLLDETNCRPGYLVEVCRQYRGVMREKVE